METWLLLALIPLFLWSISNFIDKVLLSKFFPAGSVSVLMVYSGLFGIVAAPVFLFIDPSAVHVPFGIGLALFGVGLLGGTAIWFYLYALAREDASTVVPFFQLIPIFNLLFGFLILGEVLSARQITLGALIITGGFILSLELSDGKKFGIKWSLIGWMLLCDLFWAGSDALFKHFALEQGFWASAFWQSIGLASIGFALLLIPEIRRVFMAHARRSGPKIFGLNLLNEIANGAGNAAYAYVLLLAPIALVALTHVYQSIVVFGMGLLLSAFVPQLIKEDRSPRVLIQKIIGIAIIAITSYFLFS